MALTTVVHCKRDPYDVLIDRTTVFGNPFPEWKWGREVCIQKHRTYFYARLERDLEFKEKVLALSGKVLGCWCVPKPCHGHTVAEYIDTYEWVEQIRLKAEGRR